MAVLLFLTSVGGSAAGPLHESWLPVVGQVSGGGRSFYTTLYLTNLSKRRNQVALSFFAEAQPNATPRAMSVQLEPDALAAVEVDQRLTGPKGAIGGLRIEATEPLRATANVYSRAADQPPGAETGMTMVAISSEYAIGTHESALLTVPAGVRYKLYAVETHGFPLNFSVQTMPSGSERRLYLSPHEQRSWDVHGLFPNEAMNGIRVTGINGSGKILAAGTAIAQQSSDFTAYVMTLPSTPRHFLRWPEISAYVAAAIAITAAAIYRVKTNR
jgi:hypothetical protein